MSELINKHDSRVSIRWTLLASVSMLALGGYTFSATVARADDGGHPQVWIELGGQLSRLDDSQEAFAPSFLTGRPAIFSQPEKFERPSRYSIDEVGKLTFQPKGLDWVFTASVSYGRASSNRHIHQQTYAGAAHFPTPSHSTVQPRAAKFADTNSTNSQSHLILDFAAGKDVGMGMFGQDSSSIIEAGVRFAQFHSKTNIALKSDPDFHFSSKYLPTAEVSVPKYQAYHTFAANMQARRSFHGVGPTISWDGSAPLVGNQQDGQLSVDWGINAAVLFGRQKAATQHQTSGHYYKRTLKYTINTHYQHPAPPQSRSRNVVVPNIGGSVGASYRVENFKVSFGYRADMFFNAMDVGIDARKSKTVGFYGPFANVSIGLP